MTSSLPPASSATIQNQPTTAQTTQEGIVSDEKNDARNREKIALAVLFASIAAVFALSATIIFNADPKERPQVAQNVMGSTLPLYGTWVGTILAFYFSRNAFEAASSATDRSLTVFQQGRNDLVSAAPPDNKLANISLKSLANGLVFSYDDNTNKTLQEIVNELNDKNRYRVIVVKATTKTYVDLVYRVNASAFLTQPQSGASSQPGVTQPTLTNYLDWRHTQGEQAQPIVVFLPETATLADADAKMKETLGCRDVIVTTDGQKTSPVVAYITDNDIDEYR
jgi:hypothetical protein